MRTPSRSAVLPILILVAAIALWITDTYRNGNSGPSSKQSPSSTSDQTTGTGRYETYANCTIVSDRVNDGDSFKIRLPDGRVDIFRLYFVDSPESAFKTYAGGRDNHQRISEQAAALGGISSQQAVEIGKKAKELTLSHLGKAPFTIHTGWDSPFNDQRYHAYIVINFNGKPRFLHELLIEKGLARIHTKGAKLPDGTSQRKQEAHLRDLENTAKSSKAGAWAL